MSLRSLLLCATLALALPALTGCQSVYYEAWEALGREKRDILRSELSGMVGDQEDAEEAFTDALTRMKHLTGFDGGDLETEYDKLKSSYDDASGAVSDIDGRMEDVNDVATDMFAEWQSEIGQMQTPNLKNASRRKLAETRERYASMRRSLVDTRTKMDPVLALLNDHVLFLKHNLNAASIGSLGREMREVEYSIEDLKDRIQSSIREAQAFLATMQ